MTAQSYPKTVELHELGMQLARIKVMDRGCRGLGRKEKGGVLSHLNPASRQNPIIIGKPFNPKPGTVLL